MPVQVQQEQIDHCHVALTIEVPPEEFQKAVDSVFNQFAKRASIPGFRPGKAPRHLLKRVIDEDQVKELALERAVTNAFQDAIRQAGVQPYGDADPQVEMPEEELDPEKGFSFKATVALRPHVHLCSLEGLEARRVTVTVTDEDVQHEIDRLREAAAGFQPTDEAAQEEDRLRATAEVLIHGEPVPDLTFAEPTLFEIGANLEEFDAGLRGLHAGEEKTFEFTFPEDMDDPELKGETATARVKAVEVLRRTVPEADDELARKLGFDDLEALRTRVRENLQAQADLLAEQEMLDGLLDTVVRASEVHYPEELVEAEVSSRMDNLIAALDRRGFSLDDYLAAEKTNLVAVQARLRREAEEALANTLVMLDLAREHDIRVTEKEVEAEVRRRAEQENVKVSQMRRLLHDTGEIDTIRNRLFRRNVAAFLKGKAEIRELQG
jgi:trigger factor